MALLVNTHYKMPWIVWSMRYSIQVAAGEYKIATIQHGLPFVPLLTGQWSPNRQFNPSYDLGAPTPGGAIVQMPDYLCDGYADDEEIRFALMNNTSTSAEFNMKLMAFAPPDYTGDVNPVNYNSPFSFNSHYRYQQLFMQGRARGKVTHGLGYLPQAKLWSITQDSITPYKGILTETTYENFVDNEYYYHIYKDAF